MLDYSLGLLNLDTSSFTHPDKIYEIQVMIQKDTRFAVARVELEVMKLTPPAIDIKYVVISYYIIIIIQAG